MDDRNKAKTLIASKANQTEQEIFNTIAEKEEKSSQYRRHGIRNRSENRFDKHYYHNNYRRHNWQRY